MRSLTIRRCFTAAASTNLNATICSRVALVALMRRTDGHRSFASAATAEKAKSPAASDRDDAKVKKMQRKFVVSRRSR